MAACFFVSRSVCLIWSPALLTGVVFASVAFAVGCSTNQPYCDVLTLPSLFVGSEKSSLSNSGTVWPFGKLALPHLPEDDGSCEYFFASVHQVLSPAPASCPKSELAREALFLPTRM